MSPSKGKRDEARAGAGDAQKAVARGLGDHLFERMTDAFIALDEEWRVVYMNSAAMGLNAKPRPDVIGRSHWEEWPHTLGSEVERQYRLAMQTQRPVHFEYHYTLPGQDFWHAIHAYPDANGLSIFYRDITEQKRKDEFAKLLADAGSRLAATLDKRSTLRTVAEMALPLLGDWCCVYLVDETWRVTDVDAAATDERRLSVLRQVVSQLPVSAADSRLPFNRAMHDDAPVLLAPLDESFYAMLGDPALEDFVRALAPQSLLCVPLTARDRTIGGITFGTSQGHRPHDQRDVLAAQELALPAALALDSAHLFEAERRARREADDARQRAEDANRSKVEFLRAISHELRTPLNAMGGYAQLLLMGVHGELTPQQRSDVERIERNHHHVTHLISDVLSFVRLEAGRMEFDSKRVLVNDLLRDLEGFVTPKIGEQTHHLTVHECAPDVAVWADAAKATQILVNLIANAVKHTPPDTAIEVRCQEGQGDDPVRISVRDTGPGIAHDKQEAIFEPFVQLGRRLSRPVEGLGLGLAIARDLARAMGGDLSVQSEVGLGATFTLTLPRR